MFVYVYIWHIYKYHMYMYVIYIYICLSPLYVNIKYFVDCIFFLFLAMINI